MATAGFCKVCGQYVWLNEQWGCVNGHAWSDISNWYDPSSGTPVTPYWLQPQEASAAVAPAVVAAPEPAPVAAAPSPEPQPQTVAPMPEPEPAPVTVPESAPGTEVATRLQVLAEILGLLSQYPNYRSQYGTDTDIVIDNQVADASWATGKKKVEYQAILKAVEPERTIYFWEVLKEKGGGLSFGSMESESYSTFGTKRSGKTKEVTFGPGGVVANAEWDYGATRQIVESIAVPSGWKLKVVLRKSAAQW